MLSSRQLSPSPNPSESNPSGDEGFTRVMVESPATVGVVSESPACTCEAFPPFSIEALLRRFGGNSEIVEQILSAFEDETIRDLEFLAKSIKTNDRQRIVSLAHALKGTAGLMSAQTMYGVAAALEQKSRRGEMDGAEASLVQLKREANGCLAYVAAARDRISEPSGQNRARGEENANTHRR